MFEPGKFFPIMPTAVEVARPYLEPWLREFEAKTCLVTAEDVFRQAKLGECQLWTYHDGEFRGAVATRIYTNAVGRICQLWVCIGVDVDELIDGVYAQLERWARDSGCYAMEIVGRAGWERRLPGYKRKAVVLEKLLESH